MKYNNKNKTISYFSTLFNLEKKHISNTSENKYSFQENYFVVNIPYNEITINYSFKYVTKSNHVISFIILMIWIAISGYFSLKIEKYKTLSFTVCFVGYLLTLSQSHREGYSIFTIFNLIPTILVCVVVLMFFRKKNFNKLIKIKKKFQRYQKKTKY